MSENGTMMQYFEWNLPFGILWKQLKKEAPKLASAGITGVRIPPCYKGNSEAEDVSYAVYGLYALGEFDQTGSVPTKYGPLKELLAAIRTCHGNGLHLHKAVEALKKYEKKEWLQVIPGTGEYPELLYFKTQKEYVREMPASQIALTADRETFGDIHDLPAGHEFFDWQKKVDGKTRNVPNHEVAEEYIGKNGRDYRSEETENPVPALQDRKADNTEIGRIR